MMKNNENENLCIDEIVPDNELLLWEKWIKIRKEETTKLGQKLKRPPVDLTMNLLEKVRSDRESKITLEHAQIDKKPTVRGALWEQPQRLKQACYCHPVYEVHRTRTEMGRPPIIEHVIVPDYIQVTEKGLSGVSERNDCTNINFEYKQYKEKRQNDLKEKIKKIDPFRPSRSGLMIKGSKPKAPLKKMTLLPSISIEPAKVSYEEELSSVYALRINHTVLFKDIPGQTLTHIRKMQDECWHESCTSWTYYFNIPVKRAGRSKLYLRNLGTVALRYCWKKIKSMIPFIPEELYEQVFFFNKNEDVLSPGQTKEIYFTFVSDKAGIYGETWELCFCNICFFDSLTEKLVVNLNADSVDDVQHINRKAEKLKYNINKKAIYNIVKNIIDIAIEKAATIEPKIYPYKKLFLEAEMFIMKNPVLYYHQSEVKKMKEMYTEMVPVEMWDLSITSWRKVMMEKEYDDRMKYYELLRKSHIDLLKPWYEGDNLMKQKYRAINLLLGQLASRFDIEYINVSQMYGMSNVVSESVNALQSKQRVFLPLLIDSHTKQIIIHNVFYLRIYEHMIDTIELCAGVLSSLDLNRWIQFDFCR